MSKDGFPVIAHKISLLTGGQPETNLPTFLCALVQLPIHSVSLGTFLRPLPIAIFKGVSAEK